MKDCAKQQIEIGDICATNQAGYTCALFLYEVVGFTDKKVKLIRKYSKEVDIRKRGGLDITLKFPEQICVIKGLHKHPA